jgi:hypothetical protein
VEEKASNKQRVLLTATNTSHLTFKFTTSPLAHTCIAIQGVSQLILSIGVTKIQAKIIVVNYSLRHIRGVQDERSSVSSGNLINLLFNTALVCLAVETGEQVKIACHNKRRDVEEGIAAIKRAIPVMWEVGPVSCHQARVALEVDKSLH